MDVEFTAKQVKITKTLQAQAEKGMKPIARLLGKTASANITFNEHKRKKLVIAEITINARMQKFASEGQGETAALALHQALERMEVQVRRHRDRRLENKRLPTGEKTPIASPVTRTKTRASKQKIVAGEAGGVSSGGRMEAEPHIVAGDEAFAQSTMTVEEAVKEIEAQDRDLLIFRDSSGVMFVVHRRRDGQVELAELP